MSMTAITNNYSSGDSAVEAILAGADIILMPNDYKEAFNGIYNAVISGEISKTRLDESVERVLKLKEKYNIK